MRKLTFGGVCFRHSPLLFPQVCIYPHVSHVSHALHTFCTRFENADNPPAVTGFTRFTRFIFYILYIYRYPHKDIRGYRGIYIKGIERFFACKRVNPCCYWLYGIFYACGSVLFWEVKSVAGVRKACGI